MTGATRCGFAGLCMFVGACATPPRLVENAVPSASVKIEALVRRGCYECLRVAHAQAKDARLTEYAFETALLLAARSKELGLPHTDWISIAQNNIPAGRGWQDYLDIVLSQPLDPFS